MQMQMLTRKSNVIKLFSSLEFVSIACISFNRKNSREVLLYFDSNDTNIMFIIKPG